MVWGIVHRKILFELLKIFSLAFVTLTGIIVMAGVISEAMKNNFGLSQILGIIPLLLPSLLPYTVPTTTLFATCIVYGRLSADNEILALKAAGVHIIHVVWPALLLGVVTSGVTMCFYFDVIPTTGSMLRNPTVGDVDELLYMMLRKDGYIKNPKLAYQIYVKNVRGRQLIDAQFMRRAATGKGFDVIARAKEAQLRYNANKKMIDVQMLQCHIQQPDGTLGYVEARTWEIDLPPNFGELGAKFRAMDMTWRELSEYYEKLKEEKRRISSAINTLQAELLLREPTPADKKTLQSQTEDRKTIDRQIFSIQTEWLVRPALSFGCLCFALVGCPVGIWFSKSDYLSAFITCFLPIVVIYYPLMFCMLNMSSSGRILPWMGIFNADGLTLFAGAVLFHRLARN